MPKARWVILTPGGDWRRLYSLRSTADDDLSDDLRGRNPLAIIFLVAKVVFHVRFHHRIKHFVLRQAIGI